MKLGTCKVCHYGPVAKDAIVCPQCGQVAPNPGFISQVVNFIVGTIVTVIFLGIGVGVIASILNK